MERLGAINTEGLIIGCVFGVILVAIVIAMIVFGRQNPQIKQAWTKKFEDEKEGADFIHTNVTRIDLLWSTLRSLSTSTYSRAPSRGGRYEAFKQFNGYLIIKNKRFLFQPNYWQPETGSLDVPLDNISQAALFNGITQTTRLTDNENNKYGKSYEIENGVQIILKDNTTYTFRFYQDNIDEAKRLIEVLSRELTTQS